MSLPMPTFHDTLSLLSYLHPMTITWFKLDKQLIKDKHFILYFQTLPPG